MKCTVVLAVMMLSLCAYREVTGKPAPKGAKAPPQPISPVLQSPDTYGAVREVSRHAQKEDTDTDTILIRKPNMKEDHQKVCCLHANILGYYLNSILPLRHDMHHQMPQLREDLARVARDLSTHGCVIDEYEDHANSVAFKNELKRMGPEGINKAIGEIDILFTYLTDFCVVV
ncbi:interleukin-22 [Hypomesus transpacificus]|uniref:interleukin-22 n=1 Tax=Hypomesus transpacificus TaxID=137520 RepID=UPI001F078C2F|nr:interleukin-22 [Hypomesus transpacificus]